jgi:redox-sensitive bicupin YhaK (pirin superfamily)
MKNRTVKVTAYGAMREMGEFPVRQPLPSHYIDYLDPFLLLHHAHVEIPAHSRPLQTGVGPHPHRGFSPVTFIYKGAVHHRDSRGNSSIVHEGGTQWMNAGLGVIHSERPSLELAEGGGEQELIQLWINTPRAHKMDEPSYQAITAERTPKIRSDDGKAEVMVVAGEFQGIKGPVHSSSPVIALRVQLRQGGQFDFPLPAEYNAYCYLLDGKLDIGDHGVVEEKNLVAFNTDGDGISITALEDTRCIIMAGQPLNEPMEASGPFVMSNQTEIMEAMRDYRMGKMGFLVEE